tara:strand:+ start:323 stop:493 length:171 start_codon:yes stop_codon:yes gene_type:complete
LVIKLELKINKMNKIQTILEMEYNLQILYPDETIENQLKNLQKDINEIYEDMLKTL